MKKSTPLLSIVILISCQIWTIPPLNAQFNKILKRTGQKLEREIERRAVEKASDIIAREIANTMEREFDEWLEQAAERDSSYSSENGDSAAYRMGRSYGEFLKGMNESVDLPESYSFDTGLRVEIQEEEKDPEQMWIYMSKTEPLFAMRTSAEKGESQIILMDASRDAIVMYTENDDGKTAQAIPSFSGLIGNQEEAMQDYHIESTGKRAKVAGYSCKGYRGWSDDYEFEFYTTDELGLSWSESFGPIMAKFGGDDYVSKIEDIEGVSLKSLSWKKGKEKKVTRWETIEVSKDGLVINNSDYTMNGSK